MVEGGTLGARRLLPRVGLVACGQFNTNVLFQNVGRKLSHAQVSVSDIAQEA